MIIRIVTSKNISLKAPLETSNETMYFLELGFWAMALSITHKMLQLFVLTNSVNFLCSNP